MGEGLEGGQSWVGRELISPRCSVCTIHLMGLGARADHFDGLWWMSGDATDTRDGVRRRTTPATPKA